jgi:hypothetical protein
LTWAYLYETQDSYAIEKEAPSEDKARTFIRLLRQPTLFFHRSVPSRAMRVARSSVLKDRH